MKLLKVILVVASFSAPMLAQASAGSKCDAPSHYNKDGKPLEAKNVPAPAPGVRKAVRATAT